MNKYLAIGTGRGPENLLPFPVYEVESTLRNGFALYGSDFKVGQFSRHCDEIKPNFREALKHRAKLLEQEIENLKRCKQLILEGSEKATDAQAQAFVENQFGPLTQVK